MTSADCDDDEGGNLSPRSVSMRVAGAKLAAKAPEALHRLGSLFLWVGVFCPSGALS